MKNELGFFVPLRPGMKKEKIVGHSAMMGAEIMWGLGAPLGKVVFAGSVTPLLLTDFRIVGAAILFWVVSFFIEEPEVSVRDHLALFGASLLAIVLNQGFFMLGLSYTTPINATIITTSLPIVTILMAAVFLHERVTRSKVGGVFLGAVGALVLITGGSEVAGTGSVRGDLMVLTAQICFSCYLIFFKGLIGRYKAVTLMKWMFTYATLCMLPVSVKPMAALPWESIPAIEWWICVAYAVGPTFLSYLLLPLGQARLSPAVVSIYNYVQPVVAAAVAVWAGMDTFTPAKAAAVVLVFTGVFLVSRR